MYSEFTVFLQQNPNDMAQYVQRESYLRQLTTASDTWAFSSSCCLDFNNTAAVLCRRAHRARPQRPHERGPHRLRPRRGQRHHEVLSPLRLLIPPSIPVFRNATNNPCAPPCAGICDNP